MKKSAYRHSLSDISVKILKLGLPLIIGYLIYLVISIASHTNTAKKVLIHIYLPQLEYIMMSLCVIVIGAILFDITKKEMDMWNK